MFSRLLAKTMARACSICDTAAVDVSGRQPDRRQRSETMGVHVLNPKASTERDPLLEVGNGRAHVTEVQGGDPPKVESHRSPRVRRLPQRLECRRGIADDRAEPASRRAALQRLS